MAAHSVQYEPGAGNNKSVNVRNLLISFQIVAQTFLREYLFISNHVTASPDRFVCQLAYRGPITNSKYCGHFVNILIIFKRVVGGPYMTPGGPLIFIQNFQNFHQIPYQEITFFRPFPGIGPEKTPETDQKKSGNIFQKRAESFKF